MAVKAQQNELILTRRHLMLFLIVMPLLLALAGFAVQGSQVPAWPGDLVEPEPRGRILASDGTVLAEGQPENRHYPEGTLAAHLVGFSGRIQPDGRYGLEGIEYIYDELLQSGRDVRLTIDPALQAAAQTELRRTVEGVEAQSGAVVMLEANTGRILAAASYPTYDPNRQEEYPRDALINRAFLHQYEPGSVLKPFTVAALMESGRLSPRELIPAEPCLRVGTNTFCDVSSHEDELAVRDVLRYSSNTGMIHLSERFTAEEQYGWLRRYGFGQKPPIDAAFARSGHLNPWQSWVPQDKASVTIGQSISVTALQLAAAYSIFANDGLYVPPYLVEGAEVPEPHHVISPEVAYTIRSMLRYTVEESGISASKIPDVTMAGKTGTADVFDNELGRYVEGDYTLSFAGMFPAERPEVVMVVFVKKPKTYTSSTYVAAPLFQAIGTKTVAHWGVAPQARPVAQQR
ncbi:MAG TPA: penicillin-binding protein 2 [Trueperaceae bacterium]